MLDLDHSRLPGRLAVGTSSFSSKDWTDVFYPSHLQPADYLTYYATRFDTVEIDATWHAMPAARTVQGWADKVPESFVFSLKVPKQITHTKYLEGCEFDWQRFLSLIEPLGEKRGPLLFQFPYVAKGKDAAEYASGDDFRRRLAAFLPLLPADGSYVVEVRNEKWLREPLFDLLAAHETVSLAVTAYFTMPQPDRWRQLLARRDLPLGYVRFLGHHRRMDKLVQERQQATGKQGAWNELVVDRRAETRRWIEVIRELLDRDLDVFAYFNNHFAGFAPGSIELFLQLWQQEVLGGQQKNGDETN